MQLLPSIILWILITISIVTAGFWLVTLFHIIRTMVRVPSLRAGLDRLDAPGAMSDTCPSVCVIVPAHNEERVIATLTAALLAQDYSRLSVVFALDRCTDQTEHIIRSRTSADPRFHILTIAGCPEPWVGKVHALHIATTTSPPARESDLLLFLDADTMPAPSCIRAAVTLMQRRGDHLISVLSTLTSDRWFERAVQPVAGMELMRQYPMVRANDHADPRPFANGQFILVRRADYDALGGHEAVKAEVLEDVWLARTFSRAGRRCGFYFSGDLLHCRMYDAWERFERGWLRIYGECASRKPDRLRRSAAIVRIIFCLLPIGSIACIIAALATPPLLRLLHVPAANLPNAALTLLAGVSGIFVWLGVMSLIYRIGRAPIWAAPASVVGGWLVAGLLNKAARNYEAGRPILWGGKEYRRDQR